MSEGQTITERVPQGWVARRGEMAFFLAAMLCGTIARLRSGLELPLWIDETFTATIATQKDPKSECRDFSRALTNIESTGSVYACRRPGN